MPIAPLSHRPWRNRKHPGDGPANDGWWELGKSGFLILAVLITAVLVIAILIGTTRSDGDPDATDTTSATAWVEGDARPGSRTGTAETFESLPVLSPDPGPNGE